MKFSYLSTFASVAVLSVSVSAHPHILGRQLPTTTRLPPYPTGSGFDVPPLSRITANGTPAPTVALPSLPPNPQATAPIRGAPPVPDLVAIGFRPQDYPELDKVPPTNSSQVQQWLREIDGYEIPDWAPSLNGTCDGDPTAASEAGEDGRCWWTCGKCVRETDITDCNDQGDWGVTFDDGPSPFTPKLLHYLNSVNVKATFYVVGSRVVSRPDIVQYQYQTGHELSVHTWSHRPLTSLTTPEVVAELGWTRKAIKDVTGVQPVTMRPPFGDIDDRVRAIALAMGMTPVLWSSVDEATLDTKDYLVAGGVENSTESVAVFREILSNSSKLDTGIIVLEHDLYEQAVDLAIGFHLPHALPRFTLKPVNTCLNRTAEDAYLETTSLEIIRPPLTGINNSATFVPDAVTSSTAVTSSVAATPSPIERLDQTLRNGAEGLKVGLSFAGIIVGLWAVL